MTTRKAFRLFYLNKVFDNYFIKEFFESFVDKKTVLFISHLMFTYYFYIIFIILTTCTHCYSIYLLCQLIFFKNLYVSNAAKEDAV